MPYWNEFQRRLYVASEAKSLGRGGKRLIEKELGISHNTINTGIIELESSRTPPLNAPPFSIMKIKFFLLGAVYFFASCTSDSQKIQEEYRQAFPFPNTIFVRGEVLPLDLIAPGQTAKVLFG